MEHGYFLARKFLALAPSRSQVSKKPLFILCYHFYMKHPKEEQTLIIIKPDGIQRNLVGEIITRFEKVGLKIAAVKMLVPSAEHVEAHYTLDPAWRIVTGEKSIKAYTDRGQKHPVSNDPMEVTAEILRKLKKYIASGPVIPMVLKARMRWK